MPRVHPLVLLLPCVLLAAPAAVLGADDIVAAARDNDLHAVRHFLAADSTCIADVDAAGYTALHWAAIRAHWMVVDHLLDAGAPVDVVGADGGSPLHWACHHDRPDVVARMLDAGADAGLANRWARTPLHVVARRGCVETARLLLARGADPAVATNEGWTPLHVAYKSGQDALVSVLLAAGADPDAEDENGERPADQASPRAPVIDADPASFAEYLGIYDLGGGFEFKVWREGERLMIREFAPDELLPIGPDTFRCFQEPWIVSFDRDEAGAVAAVDVQFLRRTVRGERREAPQYVGSQRCAECHMDRRGDAPYMKWLSGAHAGAYWRLATDWALFLGRNNPAYAGITSTIDDERCLMCHRTTDQDPDAIAAEGFRMEEGVGCEACHGPGSLYMDPEVMADRERFLAAGGVVPDEDVCRKCHRRGEFVFADRWEKIAHARSLPAGGADPH